MPFCAQFLKGGNEAQYCERRETARGCLVEKNASRPSYFFIIGAERICFKLNGRCLLDAIQHKRSISAAATTVEMSYRHAWTMIREINEAAGVKLVEDAAGGSRGCGARLTDDGILTLGVYKRASDSIRTSVATAVELTVKQKLEKSRSRRVQK